MGPLSPPCQPVAVTVTVPVQPGADPTTTDTGASQLHLGRLPAELGSCAWARGLADTEWPRAGKVGAGVLQELLKEECFCDLRLEQKRRQEPPWVSGGRERRPAGDGDTSEQRAGLWGQCAASRMAVAPALRDGRHHGDAGDRV